MELKRSPFWCSVLLESSGLFTNLSSAIKPMLCSQPCTWDLPEPSKESCSQLLLVTCVTSHHAPVLPATDFSTVLFPIMISVGLLSKTLVPHHLFASTFALIALLTKAPPSLCTQLERAVDTKHTGKRTLSSQGLSLAWLWASVTNPECRSGCLSHSPLPEPGDHSASWL